MPLVVYNAALLIGWLFAAVGAGVLWGPGAGLIVAGGLLLALTFATLYVSRWLGIPRER